MGHKEEEDDEETMDDDISLRNAPTVEYLVRNAILRNKAVQMIIEDIIESVYAPIGSRKYGGEVESAIFSALESAFQELRPKTSKERLGFASGVADALLEEMRRTAEILEDINELKNHVKLDITPKRLEQLKEVAGQFMEDVMPIASLLALGQLDLETMFKDDPNVKEFVGQVTDTAERTAYEFLPQSVLLVDDVILSAVKAVNSMENAAFLYEEDFLGDFDPILEEYLDWKARNEKKIAEKYKLESVDDEEEQQTQEKCLVDDVYVRRPTNPKELEAIKEKRLSAQPSPPNPNPTSQEASK